jgi:photosystem II stability/assembly factor-like uncharacterized protein
MKNFLYLTLAILLFNPVKNLNAQDRDDNPCHEENASDLQFPYDYFFIQRSYPDYKEIFPGLERAKNIARQAMNSGSRSLNFNLQWQIEGPTDIGGRTNVIAIDPTNPSVMYTGTSGGGIFKTTDGGNSWNSVVDTLSYFAVGDIEIDPNNHNTIYVGLGDPNIRGYVAYGNGILKSTDSGSTWHNIGLAETRIISKIAINPLNSNTIYAGAMGLPSVEDTSRGLYKSTDGGQTWSQVLFVSDSAGIIDVILDYADTNTIYATSWNRVRQQLYSVLAGPDAKIWKSTDGGTTWNVLTNGLPTGVTFSRISIAQSSQNHNTLYAEYVDSLSEDLYGIYKTTDGGNTWTTVNTSQLAGQGILGGAGWYFGNLTINPYNDGTIYVPGVDMWSTSDGVNWNMVGPPWYTYQLHADKHCLRFIGQDTMILCTDGGNFESPDQGNTWNPINVMPNTQFYHVSYTAFQPGVYYGGAQDNGTTSGNHTSMNTWPRDFGGDGFQQRFNQSNGLIWYTEDQFGGIVYTDDGGNTYNGATNGINGNDRVNWDAPYIISSADPNRLYTGTYLMYKSTGSYIPNWVPVSNSLTATPTNLSSGATSATASPYTVSTIGESPVNSNNVYAGTGDGHLWRTTDQGNTWEDISGTLPNRYVTHVKASNVHANVVFVSHSGYNDNDYIPHIHYSTDTGNTWTDISGDLPPFAVNHIELTNINDSLIFVATDGGVYYTLNQGAHWDRLGTNMPFFVIYDIELDPSTQTLLAATYARSIWSIGVDSILTNYNLALTASANDTICAGSTVQLTAAGAATYVWTPAASLSCDSCASPLATPSVTTTYVVSGSIGNATATDTITVYVNPQPVSTVTQSNDTLYASAGVSYQWYFNGSAIQNATGSYYVATQTGNYSVAVSNQYGCSNTSNQLMVTISNTANAGVNAGLLVYPNPFKDYLTIEKPQAGTWVMTLRDISGRELSTQQVTANKTELDLSSFASGIYLAEFKNGSAMVVERVVKF